MIKILYSNKNIIICIKPYGVLSQKDVKGEEGLPEIISEQTGCKTVYPVHRLDRPVGGVMVYAKNSKTAALLSSEGAFEKTYLALVSGCPEEKSGILSDYLYKDGVKGKSFVVAKERKGCKYAELEYEVLAVKQTEQGEISLVKIKLHTGRTHQIRVQFASRGMPLVGDGKYGSRIKSENIGLWSHKIEINADVGVKNAAFESAPEGNSWFDIFEEQL